MEQMVIIRVDYFKKGLAIFDLSKIVSVHAEERVG
jgi:hypothetical protein